MNDAELAHATTWSRPYDEAYFQPLQQVPTRPSAVRTGLRTT